jgi:hypothetical protein
LKANTARLSRERLLYSRFVNLSLPYLARKRNCAERFQELFQVDWHAISPRAKPRRTSAKARVCLRPLTAVNLLLKANLQAMDAHERNRSCDPIEGVNAKGRRR